MEKNNITPATPPTAPAATPDAAENAALKLTRICYVCSKCGLTAAYEEQPCPLCASRALLIARDAAHEKRIRELEGQIPALEESEEIAKHDTRNGWYYQRYFNFALTGTVLPPSRYKNPNNYNDGYNEITELIFRCWFEGVKPSTCNKLIRILNLERVPL